YTALRELDEQNLDFILAEGYQGEGVVLALMNRLRKAAAEIIKA
ncbi:MAG: threonylcarbamoyl-AMP synthase, partial [Firmicutes bacterium]|nr:threonylcarbamoyl-AMP synthase [Bacillota bacterium]